MITWTQTDAYRTWGESPFIKARCEVDISLSVPNAYIYRAEITDMCLSKLAHVTALPTMEAAQAWCEETYRVLLRTETPIDADEIAVWFISEYTRLPIDGAAHRALVARLKEG